MMMFFRLQELAVTSIVVVVVGKTCCDASAASAAAAAAFVPISTSSSTSSSPLVPSHNAFGVGILSTEPAPQKSISSSCRWRFSSTQQHLHSWNDRNSQILLQRRMKEDEDDDNSSNNNNEKEDLLEEETTTTDDKEKKRLLSYEELMNDPELRRKEEETSNQRAKQFDLPNRIGQAITFTAFLFVIVSTLLEGNGYGFMKDPNSGWITIDTLERREFLNEANKQGQQQNTQQ